MEKAVIKTGGKQYLVAVGDTLQIEKISPTGDVDFKAGDSLIFDEVLFHDDGTTTTIGKPLLEGRRVEATLVEIGRAPKITVIHFKSKTRHRKKAGHRQPFFKVKIDKIA